MRLMLVDDDPVFIRTLSDRLQLNQPQERLERLTSGSPKDWKEELVRLMKTTLECWKQEGMDTGSLVRHSGIWEMKIKSAKRDYYNPELFCSADTLPPHLRWEKVVASAEFVIRNCETSLSSLELAILARQFRLNHTPIPTKSSQTSSMDSTLPRQAMRETMMPLNMAHPFPGGMTLTEQPWK